MKDQGIEKVSMKFRTDCQFKYVPYAGGVLSLNRATARFFIDDKTLFLYKINLTNLNYMYIIMFTYMKDAPDSKTKALKASGSLNLHPKKIKDELFSTHEFFDPRDRVQVKYEMLRRHRMDEKAVTVVASAFGTSRQTFYKVEKTFKQEGIPGLIGQRRGPKRAHKCSDEVLDFVQQWRGDPSIRQNNEIVLEAIKRRFGIHLNPRSIDRALIRRKKKRKPKVQAKT